MRAVQSSVPWRHDSADTSSPKFPPWRSTTHRWAVGSSCLPASLWALFSLYWRLRPGTRLRWRFRKWHSLSILDLFVRGIGKSAISQHLKAVCNDQIVKIFVSGADGGKVGFNAKTEHWTHKGMPKHEVPMSGKTWIGTGMAR
jgi:hypothetical protein